MKRIILLVVLGLLLIAPMGDFTDMYNPASRYCVEQGYKLFIREGELGQYGICTNGEIECDEWAFFNGACSLERKKCDWIYVLRGSRYNCYLNKSAGDTKTVLPLRYNGTDYMDELCRLRNCDGTPRLDFGWTGKWTTVCSVPECTACP